MVSVLRSISIAGTLIVVSPTANTTTRAQLSRVVVDITTIPHYVVHMRAKNTRSLKSLTPLLAKALGTTPDALYERQRALVRAGLLESEAGRGPGSGVRATPYAVAMLLISILSTGSLSEVEQQVKAIANLKSVDGRCPVTGKKTFAAALTATLNSEELLSRALAATAMRSGAGAMASITFLRHPIDQTRPPVSDQAEHSRFGADSRTFYLKSFAHLTVEATINLWATLRGIELGATK
jgi:hypothetical protein